jgi:hypothetical protein
MRVALRELAAEADPKRALLDALGDMQWYEPFHNLVLIATYIRPEKTTGGIYRPDRSLQEDRFQGVCGLVLRLGPMAFVEYGPYRFGPLARGRYTADGLVYLYHAPGSKGEKPLREGDWVIYRPSDAVEQFVRMRNKPDGVSCRLIEDAHIRGRVPDPSLVY